MGEHIRLYSKTEFLIKDFNLFSVTVNSKCVIIYNGSGKIVMTVSIHPDPNIKQSWKSVNLKEIRYLHLQFWL